MTKSIRKAFRNLIDGKPYDYQETIIQSILEDNHVFAVLSTGAGKSMCFQAPSYIRGGLTVVFSPLVALMKDQVDRCNQMGLPAARISHDLDSSAVRRIYRRLSEYRLLYVAPERLRSDEFIRNVSQNPNLRLIALDEVHEHSKSGQDFRPAYALVRKFIRRNRRVPVVALTATADDEVENEFALSLGDTEYVRVVASPNRSNLSYRVVNNAGPLELIQEIRGVEEAAASAIVYCATRKLCNSLSTILLRRGCNIVTYHGGLSGNDRSESQELWIHGEVPTVIATNAFGMGIDKPDVRLVYHYSIPGSVFSYVQEAGRAGRDGKQSECVLNITGDGESTRRYFIRMQNPDYDVYQTIWQYVYEHRRHRKKTTLQSLAKRCGVKPMEVSRVTSAIRYMEYNDLMECKSGVTHYVLPIRQFDLARQFARQNRNVRIRGSACDVKVAPGTIDPVPSMSARNIVSWRPPIEYITLKCLDDELTITPEQIQNKLDRAMDRLLQVYQFAAAEDKQAFIDSVFLQRAEEGL